MSLSQAGASSDWPTESHGPKRLTASPSESTFGRQPIVHYRLAAERRIKIDTNIFVNQRNEVER